MEVNFQFHAMTASPPGRIPRYSLSRSLGASRSRSERFGEGNNFLWRREQFLVPPDCRACSLVTVLNTLSNCRRCTWCARSCGSWLFFRLPIIAFFHDASLFSAYFTVVGNGLIKDGKKSHLKEAVQTSPEMSFVSNIGYFAMSNKILVQQTIHCHANAEKYPRKFNAIERRQKFSETDLQSRDRFFSSSPPGLGDIWTLWAD